MAEFSYLDAMRITTERMAGNGVFLTIPGSPDPNVMTIGWGSVGYYWRKPVFTVVVRPQRFSHDLLVKAQRFSVSVPTRTPMKAELAYAGSASGRTENKWIGHGLTPVPGRTDLNVPIIRECGLHFECAVRLWQPMVKSQMDPALRAAIYPGEDFHTLFFGEIIDCYETDASLDQSM